MGDDDGDDTPAVAPALSAGSNLHAAGFCRPCAWFHKPQGCENGAECRHCHLCPEGEIKNRRKFKVAFLRQGEMQQEHFQQVMQQAQQEWEVQAVIMQDAMQMAKTVSDAGGASKTGTGSSGDHTSMM